jgi:hypothetical protein
MSTMPTAHRPHLLVLFSTLAFGVVLILALIAFLDQHQRLNDPQTYAEKRCRVAFGNKTFTPNQFSACVAKEKAKSTIASIFPIFATGVVVVMLGISGLFVGRSQVRTHDALMKKLRGED